MLYAIQTKVGREENLIKEIEEKVQQHIYEKCFFLKRESVWRIHGTYRTYIEALFPGYVFVSMQHPNEFYQQLQNVLQYSKILGVEESKIYAISDKEELFLECLLAGDREGIIRLSPVQLDQEHNIIGAEGALKNYMDCIVQKRIRLRYVMIQANFMGKEHKIKLGICIKNKMN